jgi:acyl-CoA oxidase
MQAEVPGQVMSEDLLAKNAELHALSAAAKPMATWYARDVIQTCRECCGGHGYSAYSRIAELRQEHDPSMTYEGDNNVLIQQTVKELLKAVARKQKGKEISSPFGSMNFLNGMDKYVKDFFLFFLFFPFFFWFDFD